MAHKTRPQDSKYDEYLLSGEWKLRRECRLQMDGFECVLCGASDKLQVHHKHYRNIFREDVRRDLVTLCEDCHYGYHQKHNNIQSYETVDADYWARFAEECERLICNVSKDNEDIQSLLELSFASRLAILAAVVVERKFEKNPNVALLIAENIEAKNGA